MVEEATGALRSRRRWLLGIVVAAVVLVASGCQVTIIKRIIGDPPPGTEFTIEIDCGEAGSDSFVFTEDGQDEVFDLDLGIGEDGTCEVTETVDGGADEVTYQCEAVDPGTTCTGDNTAEIFFLSDGAIITVTNTFDPPTTTTTTTTAPAAPTTTAPPAAAAPVTADPGFTG